MGTHQVRPSSRSGVPAPGGQATLLEQVGCVELLEFAQMLCGSANEAQLERRFAAGFARLFDLPMNGFYIVDPWTGGERVLAPTGVSDSFLARYERGGRDMDWMRVHLGDTGRAVYNMALMASKEEWLENPLYRKFCYLHDIRHVVMAPIVGRDGVIGTLHCATNEPSRGVTPYEVRLLEALGRLVGTAFEGTNSTAGLVRQRDLHRLIARPYAAGDFARHIDVEMVDGGTGLLRGRSSHTGGGHGTLITALDLQTDRPEISAETLMALTPRERDVARYVVDGMSGREIAERLYLSPYTVSQYVKRIYRKLDVPSRVALTRLLLGIPRASRD